MYAVLHFTIKIMNFLSKTYNVCNFAIMECYRWIFFVVTFIDVLYIINQNSIDFRITTNFHVGVRIRQSIRAWSICPKCKKKYNKNYIKNPI